MKAPVSWKPARRIVLAGAIMPWIGFVLIVPLFFPLIMLVKDHLGTALFLYWIGFVPSAVTAVFYQLGKPRVHPLVLWPCTAIFAGAACIAWYAVLGMEIRLNNLSNLFTHIAMIASAIYFARDTLSTLIARRRAH